MQNNAKKTKLPNKTAKNSCFPAAISQKNHNPRRLWRTSGIALSGWLYPAGFIRIAFIRLALSGWP